MRYEYARYRTREKALEGLEDMFAEGDVSQGEKPDIVCRKDHRGRVRYYAVTLEDYA